MLSHKIAMIISLQFSYLTFHILFDSAMKYLSVCYLIYFHLKTHRRRFVTIIYKPMTLIRILNLYFVPDCNVLLFSFNVIIKWCFI